jgi:hypothetical protein
MQCVICDSHGSGYEHVIWLFTEGCSLVEIYQSFGETYWSHLQGQKVSQHATRGQKKQIVHFFKTLVIPC